MNLIEKLNDLLLQATTERSHYYVASVIKEVLAAMKEKDKKIRILSLKCAGSLAHNLCPDHRDKQVGKRCLACIIEERSSRIEHLLQSRQMKR